MDGFNLNEAVWVRLTPFGRRTLEASYEFFEKYGQSAKESADRRKDANYPGFYRFQLRDLMQTFGPTLTLGARDVPFKDNVLHFTKPERGGASPQGEGRP
jgi:hypothetical protein